MGWLLLVLIGLPIVAALLVALLGAKPGVARVLSLIAVTANLGFTITALVAFLRRRLTADLATDTFSPLLSPRPFPLLRLGLDSNSPAIQFFVGLDGLNVWLIALTAVLALAAVLASWHISERANEYHAWLLVLLTGLNGVFAAFDVILFYGFFELTLVPLYFLVSGWGGNGRREAARKLFLYTLAGSLLTLVGIVTLVVVSADREPRTPITFAIPELVRNLESKAARTSKDVVDARANLKQVFATADSAEKERPLVRELVVRRRQQLTDATARRGPLPMGSPERKAADDAVKAADAAFAVANTRSAELDVIIREAPEKKKQATERMETLSDNWTSFRWFQFGVFVLICVGFAVKVPLIPVHTWLPTAYTEAPLATTFLLAGVLAKMGTYGLLRLVIPLMPDLSLAWGLPILGTLGAIGIIYGALCAYAQTDLKRLVAYSSLSHLGFIVVGLFALNTAGLAGGLMQMVNHGLTTGALFLLVGMLADRYQTRDSGSFSGLMGKFPILTLLMMVACLASVGLPGLNSFVAEMLMMGGIMQLRSTWGYWMAAAGAAGIVLGAWYLFTMLRSVFFGPLKEPEPLGATPVRPSEDITGRELAAVVPLLALSLLLGVLPQPMLRTSAPEIKVISTLVDKAQARQQTTDAALDEVNTLPAVDSTLVAVGPRE